MNDREALRQIDELRSKGWEFQFEAVAHGWECRAKGPGLSHADCGGSSFEEAAERAIAAASSMEDDPGAFIAQYASGLMSALVDAFGPEVKYRIEAQEAFYDWGPKAIHIIIAPGHVDVQKYVDQEGKLYQYTGELERKTRVRLHVEAEWPNEEKAPT